MELAKGMKFRGVDTGKVFELVEPRHDLSLPAWVVKYEGQLAPNLHILTAEGIRRATPISKPDIDWKTVAEGPSGEPVVCLKCGGPKPGCVFTCDPCWKTGGAEIAIMWQKMKTSQKIIDRAQQVARWKDQEERAAAVAAAFEAQGRCRDCNEMPTVPPGMTTAVRDQVGCCWTCHLKREAWVADEMSRAGKWLEPVSNPLKLEPYDNNFSGVGSRIH